MLCITLSFPLLGAKKRFSINLGDLCLSILVIVEAKVHFS